MKKIRVLFVINFLFLVIFCFEFVKTYAVFESDVSMDASSRLAVWKVLVNDVDITRNNSFAMEDISWDKSSKVLSGHAAPGLAGYFDIVISASNTEVAFRYDVKFDFSLIDNQEFVINSVMDVNGGKFVRTDKDVYSGIFSLDDINNGYIADIRVNLIWNDNSLNDEIDYKYGSVSGNEIVIPVVIDVVQSTNLELVEYVEN